MSDFENHNGGGNFSDPNSAQQYFSHLCWIDYFAGVCTLSAVLISGH